MIGPGQLLRRARVAELIAPIVGDYPTDSDFR
jgi:hypothetical protein